MAHSSRTWTGARTPSAMKRVRQTARRRAVLQPRRSAAKTYVSKALAAATQGDTEQTLEQMRLAVSALDKAAKTGAIHRNAADRRKSRLMLKINAALGGEALVPTAKVQRQTGKAAAAKAAKARIAAGKAAKSKGEQTAAGKARAALTRSTRRAVATEAPATPTRATGAGTTPAKPPAKAAAKGTTAKASSNTKPTASRGAAGATKSSAKATTAKPAAKTTRSSTRG